MGSLEITRAVIKPAVAATVGDRIYSNIADQNAASPYVVISEISVVAIDGTMDHHDLDQVRVQVDAWAASSEQAQELADLIRDAMRARGHLMVFRFGSYDSEADLHQVVADFYVWI